MAEAEWKNGGGGGIEEYFTAIDVGECGQGKSTVAFNLRLRPHLNVPMDGVASNGVTKTFDPYKADLQGSGNTNGKLIDSPGIGDGDVNLITWVATCEKAFKEVNAIIVCVSECNPRITLGAELVTNLVNKGFLGDVAKIKSDPDAFALLCNSIVVVGTQGNLAGPRLRAAMPETVKSFAQKCALPEVSFCQCPSVPGWQDDGKSTPVLDVSSLQKHLSHLKDMIDSLERRGRRQHQVMKYTRIQAHDVIDMVCKAAGVEVTEEVRRKMAEELGVLRNLIAAARHLFSFDHKARMEGWKRLDTSFRTLIQNATTLWTEAKHLCTS